MAAFRGLGTEEVCTVHSTATTKYSNSWISQAKKVWVDFGGCRSQTNDSRVNCPNYLFILGIEIIEIRVSHTSVFMVVFIVPNASLYDNLKSFITAQMVGLPPSARFSLS